MINPISNQTRSRLAFIDLLRGWALLVMIEVHVFNAFLQSGPKAASWFQTLTFINGLVAPSFTFISGFVFLIASRRKLESFRSYGSAFWKQIGRISLIWIIGYALHLPFFSFYWMRTATTETGWLMFYQVDILQCIAFGVLVLFLLRLAIRSDRTYRIVLAVLGVTVIVASPFVWDIDFLQWIPDPLAAYINSRHYSLFPLFPWLGFMLFGGVFAAGYITAREQHREREYIVRLAVLGAIVVFVSIVGRELLGDSHIGSSDIRANPLFFFERLGIVVLLLVACWFYAEYRKTEKSFVLDVGRESLMVYTAHLLVIYGRFWNERSLAFYYGETWSVTQCIASTLLLAAVMSAAAIGWGWMKRNHMPLARVWFWLFSGTVTAMFFIR
jgi:uncharacterized membrane protein